ncbi:unnamed protein product [Bemisia tabaci]|uniref:LIM zinc-binding domain-containing protein n=2 Tax=Bemisia tabaci TaxID=7038 RepID=A0A9P0A5G9_BEMTA|nr:unnamed protein product [Bemisia tabaci]
MVMRAKSNVYHLDCFACQQCNHRFCVGDRFYLCDNKILCEYDYEERLVFANMAYNPSSLAHIRRQVSQLQPAAGARGNVGGGVEVRRQTCGASCFPSIPTMLPSATPPQIIQQQQQQQHRDDGSSGYGSPDSETFESTTQ